MCDIFNTIGMVPYNKKKLEKEEEINRWEKFSGIKSLTNIVSPAP